MGDQKREPETIVISTSEARIDLSELLNRVYYGDAEVVLTKYGKPVAVLVNPARLAELKAVDESDEE